MTENRICFKYFSEKEYLENMFKENVRPLNNPNPLAAPPVMKKETKKHKKMVEEQNKMIDRMRAEENGEEVEDDMSVCSDCSSVCPSDSESHQDVPNVPNVPRDIPEFIVRINEEEDD